MNRLLKTILVGFVALATLLAGGVAFVVATFDPETYKPLLIERVQQDWQRTLSIPGKVRLSLFPRIGVQLGELALSERGGPAPFASAKAARLSLAVWPLLRRQVVIDRVLIDGLQATMVREADGRTSIDDLLGGPGAADKPAAPATSGLATGFDIAGLSIRNAAITVDDRASRRKLSLTGIQIETGRLAPGVASALRFSGQLTSDPVAVDLSIELQGRLRLDPGQQRHGLEDFALSLNGRLAGQAGASLTLGGAVDADLKAGRIALTGLALDAAWPRAEGGPIQLSAKGQASAMPAKQTLDARLSGTVDQSAFDARIGMTQFSPAAYTFDVKVDRLDLDRVMAGGASAPAGSAAPGETAIDLTPLRDLNAQGQLAVGELRVAKMQLSKLRTALRAAAGRIELNPVAAELYGGQLGGSVALDARATPRLSLRQSLTGVQIGPMLKDALGRDSLEGRGDVNLDVAAQGGTVSALRQTLAGSARAELRDGAVRGVNVAQAIRRAKARLGVGGGEQAGAGSRTEQTDFSELSASFRIERGVAHNDDLLAKSPLLRITGNGDIDLGTQRVDYLVKATVVTTLQGQGGPELQSLSGKTVPVRLTGPFDAIGWRIDFGAMAKDALKEKLDARTEGAKEKLRDKLKGLFGK